MKKEKKEVKEVEVFFRIKHCGRLHETDRWETYQIEVATNENGKWKKRTYSQPDVKQIIMGKLENILNGAPLEELS